MTSQTSSITEQQANRRDIHQQVTDSIIHQLEAGVIPWHKPWTGGANRILSIPQNHATGKKYRGINILLLWASAFNQQFNSDEWASLKQWNEKKESIRKGEKGSLIVYYDIIQKEVEGEIKEIPFTKVSYVFNRCQLSGYEAKLEPEINDRENLVEKLENADHFVTNTKAIIEHGSNQAQYRIAADKITMPHQNAFINTESCTATEGYYSTLLHELTHWTGNSQRLNRPYGKKFGDKDYAIEELVAELGAAFLCAELGISTPEKADHASYIAHWLQVLKDNKRCIFTAAREATKACDFLQSLQPQ